MQSQDVSFDREDPETTEAIARKWKQHFASVVKKQTGVWIHNKFRWHGFSGGFEQHMSGDKALKAYLYQWPAKFLVFNESLKFGYTCRAQSYPDFSPLCDDIYVAHHNMKWTMVFTHEQPGEGPYFAVGSTAW